MQAPGTEGTNSDCSNPMVKCAASAAKPSAAAAGTGGSGVASQVHLLHVLHECRWDAVRDPELHPKSVHAYCYGQDPFTAGVCAGAC